VPLARALSKLGILSRSQAIGAVLAGRVRVDGDIVLDPGIRVVPERAAIVVDGAPRARAVWRTIVLNKPRGVVTTRSDPQGRRTVYDVIGADAAGLVAVGRLDMATSGLLILTTDTQLANWLTHPANGIVREYGVVVRGEVTLDEVARLTQGITSRGERLRASEVRLRKASGRESHLIVELREGRNREVRRLFDAIGHEVTRLVRLRFGGIELGDLQPGWWRELTKADIRSAFARAPISPA